MAASSDARRGNEIGDTSAPTPGKSGEQGCRDARVLILPSRFWLRPQDMPSPNPAVSDYMLLHRRLGAGTLALSAQGSGEPAHALPT